jgi:hypothetical protein
MEALSLVVRGWRQEAEGICSFELEPAQGGELPPLSVPTQFLSKPFSPGDLKAALHALHVI